MASSSFNRGLRSSSLCLDFLINKINVAKALNWYLDSSLPSSQQPLLSKTPSAFKEFMQMRYCQKVRNTARNCLFPTEYSSEKRLIACLSPNMSGVCSNCFITNQVLIENLAIQFWWPSCPLFYQLALPSIYIFSWTNAVSERKATEVSFTPKITEIESQKLRLRSEEKLFSIQWCIHLIKKNKINPNRF